MVIHNDPNYQRGEHYRPLPIPAGPFRDEQDRDAALGVALVHVTYIILGRWPAADALKTAVDALVNDAAVDPYAPKWENGVYRTIQGDH